MSGPRGLDSIPGTTATGSPLTSSSATPQANLLMREATTE